MADEIFALTSRAASKTESSTLDSLPDTDRFGRTIFRSDEVVAQAIDPDLVRRRLSSAVDVIRSAVHASGLTSAKVTLKLALDAKVGLAFVGETGVESSIELEFEFKKDGDSAA